jgi:hypothetical protein
MTAAQAEPRRRVVTSLVLISHFCRSRNQLRRESAKQDAAHAERRALQEVASRDGPIHAEVFVGGLHGRRL